MIQHERMTDRSSGQRLGPQGRGPGPYHGLRDRSARRVGGGPSGELHAAISEGLA